MTLIAARTESGPARRGLTVAQLFADDFDPQRPRPAAAAAEAAPEPAAPVFGAQDVEQARLGGFEAGQAAGHRAAEASHAAAARQALEAIATELGRTAAQAHGFAEAAAQSLAQMLTEMLAAALPTLCARHGEAEVLAIARAVLPALRHEPAITVRAHPRLAAALAREIGRLDPAIAARVALAPAEAMGPSDVRIAWQDGGATRDAAELFARIAAILVPAGLLPPAPPYLALPDPTPPAAAQPPPLRMADLNDRGQPTPEMHDVQ